MRSGLAASDRYRGAFHGEKPGEVSIEMSGAYIKPKETLDGRRKSAALV